MLASQGSQNVIEDWQKLLQVRSLVFAPQDDLRTWLKYASLCRRNGRLVCSLWSFYPSLVYQIINVFTVQCTVVQSMVLLSHVVCPSVCLSVMLVDHDHIGWKPWKLIVWTISPTSSLFVAQRSSTYSHGNMERFWGENVHSTPTSITSGWIKSTWESRDLRWSCGCLFTFVGALCGYLCDTTAFLYILYSSAFTAYAFSAYAFSALTLLVGWQEGHPACKNPVWFYLSGAGSPG